MNINPISFTRKIPVSQCMLKDLSENKPVSATCYEYDCKDLFDIAEIDNLDSTWDFKYLFRTGMQAKYLCENIGEKNDNAHYYCIKDSNGEIAGLCYTKSTPNTIEVKLINSKKNSNYKYVAQNMLAIIAQKVLDTGKEKLVIKQALQDVFDFYGKTCGFKISRQNFLGRDYEIDREDIPNFINLVQRRILDISV